MRIVWDERTRLGNLAKHGLDFEDLTMAFFSDALITPSKGRRYVAVNIVAGDLVTVVFARLGSEGISVISMRPASRKERSF